LAHLRRWHRLDEGRGYVVTHDGQPIKTSVKTALTRACKLAGIEGGVTAYSLRHSAASWLVAKGLPTRKIAEFLGTSEQMIIDHYGHLAPDYQDEAALKIGQHFGGGNGGAIKRGHETMRQVFETIGGPGGTRTPNQTVMSGRL
jgi:hypothetical protein